VFAPDRTEPTTVLGVDPGLTRCGYAAISRSGTVVSASTLGVLTTPPALGVPERLRMLAADLDELLDEVAPAALAMEQVFFQANVRTAVAVAQASAVAMLAAAARGIPVRQYTPSQVKLAVTGSGVAGKSQVQAMVQRRLGLTRPPHPADAADAAALALCHLAAEPLRRSVGASR